MIDEMGAWRLSDCDVVIQDQMLSTAQQMLQDSRSKIELIRLQIIKVTQAGGGGGGEGGEGGSISSDGHQDSFTHGGQSPSHHLSEGHCMSTHYVSCFHKCRAGDIIGLLVFLLCVTWITNYV